MLVWRLRWLTEIAMVLLLAVGLAVCFGLAVYDVVRMATHASPVRTGLGPLVVFFLLGRVCYRALFRRLAGNSG